MYGRNAVSNVLHSRLNTRRQFIGAHKNVLTYVSIYRAAFRRPVGLRRSPNGIATAQYLSGHETVDVHHVDRVRHASHTALHDHRFPNQLGDPVVLLPQVVARRSGNYFDLARTEV